MGAFEDQLRHQVEQLRSALKSAEDELGLLRQRVQLLQAGVVEREALLTEARDLLEPYGGHGDDWPQIGPAISALLADVEQGRQDAATAPVLLGWWCWRCEGFNEQACRSDNVPVYVPAEWLSDMRKTLVTDKEEDE